MSQDGWNSKATQPDFVFHPVRIRGGTAAITKLHGLGVTVTYVGTGIIDVTWSEAQGQWFGMTFGFDTAAGAQAALKGWTAVAGAPSTPATAGAPVTVRVNLTNAADTLADLSATQQVALLFQWRQHGP